MNETMRLCVISDLFLRCSFKESKILFFVLFCRWFSQRVFLFELVNRQFPRFELLDDTLCRFAHRFAFFKGRMPFLARLVVS